MKDTMSNRDIMRYHNMLRQKFEPDEIVGILKVSQETLERFTPSIMSQVKRNKKHAADIAYGKAEPDSPVPEQAELPLDKVEGKGKAKKKSAADAVADKE